MRTENYYALLTELCGSLAMGRHTDSDPLFELTKEGSGPEELVKLAEAFGLMLVRVEAREYQNAQLVQELRSKNAELEALHAVLMETNEALQRQMQDMLSPGKGVIGQEKRGVYYYFPLISEKEYNGWATGRLIDRLYRGSARNLVAALVDSRGLTQADIAELRELFNMED